MITLLLPGFSAQYNGPEMSEFLEYFKSQNIDVQEFTWPHWENPDAEFNADLEQEKIWHFISIHPQQQFNIVAKSIGTYVAMLLLKAHPEFNPHKVVLMGVPVAGSLPESDIRMFPEVFARVGDKLHIVQNQQDPFGSSDQVEELFKGTSGQMHTMPENDTHAYQAYVRDVAALIRD